ncbi:tetratricopeptide repeat-containing sulfotransferase family protein [Sphingopyxis lindanitolerans]|nr:tetratricopeptide repeat-containing sulfotransferase family protein [Sphingopyxis lindanitolerans]
MTAAMACRTERSAAPPFPAPGRPDPDRRAVAGARALLRTDAQAALASARAIAARSPVCAEAHRLVAEALRSLGREAEAREASLAAVSASIHDPELMTAAAALAQNELSVAERILKDRLKSDATDVAAMRMLAELAGRLGRYRDAENLLKRGLALAPDFVAARSNLAMVLHKTARPAEAIALLDTIARLDPDDMTNANLRAAALGRIGEYDEALSLYEQILARSGDHPKLWMSYAHMLKTVGRREDSVAAYRRALSLQPGLGEAWWSLANLKTVRFSAADIAAMEEALAGPGLRDEDRFHLHFALGKAHGDEQRPAIAFDHYARGNRQRRQSIDYDADDTHTLVERAKSVFSADFLDRFAGKGCPARDPIFIVGMPRAGSTLIEQILASHSQIEGTTELPDLPMLEAKAKADFGGLAQIPPDAVRAIGEDYLARARVHRKSGKPFFIDKLPNNWMHVGFIRMILPNARVIDARRHPLDCCFSNFRQHFARGQAFSYALDDIGRYYRDYVALMDHFDCVRPGTVHRLIHERLIGAFDEEVRALLAFVGVDFEAGCRDFHTNGRAVQTASSEQVRRPINRDGVGQWRPYSEYLGPLIDQLAPVLREYEQEISVF